MNGERENTGNRKEKIPFDLLLIFSEYKNDLYRSSFTAN